MNELLKKFSAVEVKADNRITQADKAFCEKQQEAYETAISCYQELDFFWDDMVKKQKEILGADNHRSSHDYLHSDKIRISKSDISSHIQSLHTDFIDVIVNHFTSTYKVSVSAYDIKNSLLPDKPGDRWDEEKWEAYEKQMQTIIVRYENIVDQIILRLDGRSFSEQAFYELTNNCHKAAWDLNRQKPVFEQKKDTLRFTGYFCSFSCYAYSSDKWELTAAMKSIMRGASHFDSGSYDTIPYNLRELLGYGSSAFDLVEFPDCTKLVQLRMFKKGRVDLKFASPEYAEEFIDRYLGRVA